MINIPTELLRTLIAVVDLRSFTKAAQSLGVTQPAVSAQIKRLQFLLGVDLLDKSAPGVSLTSAGEIVVNHARRMLSINDQILDLAGPRLSGQTISMGVAGDFADLPLSLAISRFRAGHPDLRFVARRGGFDALFRDLREGDIDLLVGLSPTVPTRDARCHWIEPLSWVGSASFYLDPQHPLPFVTHSEECLLHRVAISSLNQANRAHDTVFAGASFVGVCSAVAAGLGVTILPRSRVDDFANLVIRDDASLPPLPDIYCGVYLRDGEGREIREQVADAFANVLRLNRASSAESLGMAAPSLGMGRLTD